MAYFLTLNISEIWIAVGMGLEMKTTGILQFLAFFFFLMQRYMDFCKLGNKVMLWLCGVYVLLLPSCLNLLHWLMLIVWFLNCGHGFFV